MDESPVAEPLDADEAFAILSDENRMAILRALWEIDDHRAPFSELHDAVEIADSGQFNYHLNELVGRFVRKTDAGYELRPHGARVVGATLAGAYTMEVSVDDLPIEEPCPMCGESMTYHYRDDVARFECTECGPLVQYPVPPGAFAGVDPQELPDRTLRYLRALGEQLRNAVCPHCEGPIDGRVIVRDHPRVDSDADVLPGVEYECARCSSTFNWEIGMQFLDHPAVVSFYHERGIDVRAESIWQLGVFGTERAAIASEDPLRATVEYEATNDAITLVVDGSLDVQSVERD